MKRLLCSTSPLIAPPRRSVGAMLLTLPLFALPTDALAQEPPQQEPSAVKPPSSTTLQLPAELGWKPLEGAFRRDTLQRETQPLLVPGQPLALVVDERIPVLIQTDAAERIHVYWLQDPTLEKQLLERLSTDPTVSASTLRQHLLQRVMKPELTGSGQASLQLELNPDGHLLERQPEGLRITPSQAGILLLELEQSTPQPQTPLALSLWQYNGSLDAAALHAQELRLQRWTSQWPQRVEPPALLGFPPEALSTLAALSRWLAAELEGTPEPALTSLRTQAQTLLLARSLLALRAQTSPDDARFEPLSLPLPPASEAVTEADGPASRWIRLPADSTLTLPMLHESRLLVRVRAELSATQTDPAQLQLSRGEQLVAQLMPSARTEWLDTHLPRQTAQGAAVGPSTLWRAYALPGEPLTLQARGGALLLQLEALTPIPALSPAHQAVSVVQLLERLEKSLNQPALREQSTREILLESARSLYTPGIQGSSTRNITPRLTRWLPQLPVEAERRRLITRLPARPTEYPGQLQPLLAGQVYQVQPSAETPQSLHLLATSDLPGKVLMVEVGGKLRSIPLLQRLEPLRIPLQPGTQAIRWEGQGIQVWLQPEPRVRVEGPDGALLSRGNTPLMQAVRSAGEPLESEALSAVRDPRRAPTQEQNSADAARVPVLRRWARLSTSERSMSLPLQGLPGQRLRLELRGEEGAGHSLDGRIILTLGSQKLRLVYQLNEADGEAVSDGLEVIRLGPSRSLTLPLPETHPNLTLQLEGDGAVWARVLVETPLTEEEVEPSVPYQPLSFSADETLRALTRLSQQLRESPREQSASLQLSQAELLASLGLESLALQLLAELPRQQLNPASLQHIEQLTTWLAEQRTQQRDAALVLPEGLAVEGLLLSPVWDALQRGEKQQAWRRLQTLTPEERKNPGALWLTARLGELLEAYPTAADAWRALARLSKEPGPLWRMAARAELLALEQELALYRTLKRSLLPAELDGMAKAALRGSADAAQALSLGEPVEGLLSSLSRFSRWRTLTHAERVASVEWLGMTPEEAGRARPLRTQAREALLGLPWPVEEGLLLSARAQAGVSVSFARPTALRLELFCVDEGGGPLDPIASPCDVGLLLNGIQQRTLALTPGRVQVEVLERLSGQHRVEVQLEAGAAGTPARRLAVRVWGEESGPTAALAAAPEPSAAWSNQLAQAERELTSGRWYPVLPSPRRRVFGARPQEPVEQTVVGPTLLEVETRVWGEPLSARGGNPRLLPEGSVKLLLRSTAGEMRSLEPMKLPTQPDAEAWLEARRGARVGQGQRQTVGLPAGVWKVQVLTSVPALVSFRVREPVLEALEEALSTPKRERVETTSLRSNTDQTALLDTDTVNRSKNADMLFPVRAPVHAGGPTLTFSSLGQLGGMVGLTEEWSEDGIDALEGAGLQLRLSQRRRSVSGWGIQGLSLTARATAEQVEKDLTLPTGLLRLTTFVALTPQLRLSFEGLGEAQRAPKGEALRAFGRMELAPLYALQPRLWLRPALGALARHDQQAGVGTFAERFVDDYTLEHPWGLTGQLELLGRPLNDVYLSGRFKATSNAELFSLDQLEGRLLAEQSVLGWTFSQELRSAWGLVDDNRSSLSWTPVLGLGARWQTPLGSTPRLSSRGWRFGVESRLRLEPLSQTWQLQLACELEQGPSTPAQNAQPGEARFAELLGQQERARQLSRLQLGE